MKLDIHGTSLYLLLESLDAQNGVVELEAVEELWNTDRALLDQAMRELAGRGIIVTEAGRIRIQPYQAWD